MADRKISDLTPLTAPAAGDYLPIVDISEAAASSKNKRITIEELMRGAPDGTAGAPGFAFESDPNSGIYSPGADQVAISTNGTGRLFVDANGTVRVNSAIQATSNGGLNVEVTSNGSSSAPFTLLNRGTSNNTGVYLTYRGLSSASAETDYAYMQMLATDTSSRQGAIAFWTANGGSVTERLRVTSAGLVGVGTSAPGALVDISGSGNIIRLGDGTNTFDVRFKGPNNWATQLDTSADTFSIQRNSTSFVTIDGAGRLGVGTTSPSTTLHVAGTPGTSTTANLLSLRNGSASNAGNLAQIDFWCSNTFGGNEAVAAIQALNPNAGANNGGALVLAVSSDGTATTPAERLRIDSSGRVGIGTSSPGAALDVLATGAGIKNVIHVRSNLDAIADGGAITFGNNTPATFQLAKIAAVYEGGTYQGSLRFYTNTDTEGANPSEKMRITRTGNVGIGTTSPGFLLDLFGTTPALRIKANGVGNGVKLEQSSATGDVELNVIDTYPLIFKNANTERARIDSSGRLLVGTSADSGGALLQVNGDRIRVATAKTPASATATGTAGEICWDADYIYVCTATNTWKRTAISTW